MNRSTLPQTGSQKEQILSRMQQLRTHDARWQEGRAWCLVYHAGEEVYSLAKEAYMMYFSENALNPSAFPSLKRMEQEVVSMAADMFRCPEAAGNMTSGGTESILLAIYTAREYALAKNPGLKNPEVIVPVTAHPAFEKAFHYFGIKPVRIPFDEQYRVRTDLVRQAVNERTILIVGSAPAYPHGVADDIPELGRIALENKVLLHVDACVGGFVLPFMRHAGLPVPEFDFSVPGVTSISADIHKYGYAAKGASLLLHRTAELRRHQFFVYSEWPGGIYASPGIGGTRPGGAIAAAWAVMNHLGWDGYTSLTKGVYEATQQLVAGINAIEGLQVLGKPDMTCISFASSKADIYAIADELTLKGWHMDRQQNPNCLHLTVNHAHLPYIDEFLADLKEAVQTTQRKNLKNLGSNLAMNLAKSAMKIMPASWVNRLTETALKNVKIGDGAPSRSAAMYGMMGSLPEGNVTELVYQLMDKVHRENPEQGS